MAFPSDIQPNIMDCGATCLRIIGRHYGRAFSISYLREVTYTGRQGTTLEGLSKGAEAIGFRTLAVKIDFKRLREEAPLPLIVHWNQNHFVVVYKIKRGIVYLSDPGSGLLKYSYSDFQQMWSKGQEAEGGIVLLLEPTSIFADTFQDDGLEEKIKLFSFLNHYVRPHRRVLLQVLLSLAAASILQLFIPFLTQSIVDTGIYKKDIGFIWLVLVAQLALTMGQLALDLLRGWMLLHVSSRINISLISDFFVKLMRLPIRYFDSRLTGDLMQRIGDHSRVESFLTNATLTALFSILTLLLYGAVLAFYSTSVFIIFFIGSTCYFAWILFFLKRREKLDYKRFQQAGNTQSKVFELINGMQEIKLHNAEQQKRWGWERIQVKLFRISIQRLALEQLQSTGSRIINEVKNIFISIICAKLVIDGQITLGAMVAVSYIIGQLNSPIIQLVGVIKSWQDATISLRRIAEIHVKEDEAPINKNAIESNAIFAKPVQEIPRNYSIFLRNMFFAYDDLSSEVLQDITLEIPAGKVTAIVGSSGSGKTTLMKLMMRFYDPSKGVICVGGTDLRRISIEAWRAHCGVVMQEGFIFNDTIAGNIAIGEDTPDFERLEEAARIANILPFIRVLPLGFNTKIGQEGLGISTGQKQRILIARAVYKNPDIIFFDEATSALDANNERIIMENLEKFYAGKTVIIIAHRLSTVKSADKIVVLEKGRIVEEGNHYSLSDARAHYYRLVKNQLELGN